MRLRLFKKKSRIKGFFDGVHDGRAIGWAFNPDNPNSVLAVDIVQGEEILASGIANIFREDLPKAGVGDGRHAFSIAINSVAPTPEVKARIKELDIFLPPSIPANDTTPAGFVPREAGKKILIELLIQKEKPLAFRKNAIAIFKKANASLATGAFPQAKAAFQQLLNETGGTALAYCKLGETSELCGLWDEARTAYQAALEIDPQFYWAYTGLGRINQHESLLNEARLAFTKAHVLNPDDTYTAERLSILRDQIHDPDIPSTHYATLVENVEAAHTLLKAVLENNNMTHERIDQ